MCRWILFERKFKDVIAYTEIDLNGKNRVVFCNPFVTDVHWEGVTGEPFPYFGGEWPTQGELGMLEMVEPLVFERVMAIIKHIEYTRLLDNNMRHP